MARWSQWREGGTPYTVGAEEGLMIVGGDHLELTPAGARVVEALPPGLRGRVSPETHASALEIQTGVCGTAADAAAELGGLRAALSRELEVRGGVEGDVLPPSPLPEIVDENHFVAARDGADALLIEDGRRVPLREVLDGVIGRCRPHAAALGCEAELAATADLAHDNGAVRQRRAVDEHGLSGVAGSLADAYVSQALSAI